tara:strand:+ start:259 stop:360 length:102 start_codon:yes stop_codon:yes gene_type:complete
MAIFEAILTITFSTLAASIVIFMLIMIINDRNK